MNLFNRKHQKIGEEVILKIEGMHCVACSLNIDDALEEIPGVYESSTTYAKAETKVRLDPQKVAVTQLKKEINSLGYEVT